MSGDEALTRLMSVAMEGSGFVNASGMRVLDVRPGEVRLAVDRRADLLQFNGHFHGAVVAGIADQAAGGAVSTLLVRERRIAVTVDLNVNYLSAADGETLIADAKALKAGSTIGVARVDVTNVKNGKENLCAVATATMRAVEMPRQAR